MTDVAIWYDGLPRHEEDRRFLAHEHREGRVIGLTTNSAIFEQAGFGSYAEALNVLFDLNEQSYVSFPFLVMPWGCCNPDASARDICVAAERLIEAVPSAIPKIPVTPAGYEAIYTLTDTGLVCAATLVFSVDSAAEAVASGAGYVCMFLSRTDRRLRELHLLGDGESASLFEARVALSTEGLAHTMLFVSVTDGYVWQEMGAVSLPPAMYVATAAAAAIELAWPATHALHACVPVPADVERSLLQEGARAFFEAETRMELGDMC